MNLINNLRSDHFLGRPGRSASQVEKSSRLNLATQFLKVAYDGACYPKGFCQNGVNFLAGKKLDDSSRLDVIEIARIA